MCALGFAVSAMRGIAAAPALWSARQKLTDAVEKGEN
jgi:hypothetical protein